MPAVKRKRDAESDARKPVEKSETVLPSLIAPQPKDQSLAFERGGAGVLTPLESRQIRAQVNQDVLFENTMGAEADLEVDSDQPTRQRPSQKITKRRKKTQDKHESQSVHAKSRAANIKVEGLSFKRLVGSSMVLGRVCEINRNDLGLSLPNNLAGYVPIYSISKKIKARITASAARHTGNGELGAQKNPDGQVDLSSYFRLGQYLRASVTSVRTHSDSSFQSKKHIELSILPEDANLGLGDSGLVVGSVLQAEVVSVEDHGLTMGLGLGDSGPVAFLPFPELESAEPVVETMVGAVILCMVVELSSNGKVIKLSANPKFIGKSSGVHFLRKVPSVASLLPGTAIQFKVTAAARSTIAGRLMDMVAVTADVFHSGNPTASLSIDQPYREGDMVKARIIAKPPPSLPCKLTVSLLEHVVHLAPLTLPEPKVFPEHDTMSVVGTVRQQVAVDKVEPGLGLFMDLGEGMPRGFAHISRLSDTKIDTLVPDEGPYKIGTRHEARVLDFNLMDGVYVLSLERRILEKPFLSIHDIKIGDFVEGTIENMVLDTSGVRTLVIDVGQRIRGYVQSIHFANIPLKRPELKFKEGKPIRARVLEVDTHRRKMQLTLKKLLFDKSIKIFETYEGIKVGTQAPVTILNITDAGALVQFFGGVRGFLPASQIGAEYTRGAQQPLYTGQVINVFVLSVDSPNRRMVVSCGGSVDSTPTRREALEHLQPGSTIQATVTEKTDELLLLKLEETSLPAQVAFTHLADERGEALRTVVDKIRPGESLPNAVVLARDFSGLRVRLTCKPSLVQGFQSGEVPSVFSDVRPGSKIVGFVKNVALFGIFVEFADGLTGLLPKSNVSDDLRLLPGFGYSLAQSITVTVLAIDVNEKRFVLALKPLFRPGLPRKGSIAISNSVASAEDQPALHDIKIGMLTVARIVSVKRTQINVELAGGAPGRVDVSAAFDSLEDVKDRKHPLKAFKPEQVISVRILGVHDSRNHRYLPISHRGHTTVFELSARPLDQKTSELNVLTLDQIQPKSSWPCFVNNIDDGWIWVNLSPAVRGRIRLLDASNDVALLSHVHEAFPVGSALCAHVLRVDTEKGRLDLSARKDPSDRPLTMNDLTSGMVLPARVTKISQNQVLVQLSDALSGPVHLTSLQDDFSKASPSSFQKNQILRVCVTGVDPSRERVSLSLRPSRTLSSSLPIKDPEIESFDQLHIGDVIRGFVKLHKDGGILVSLATNITAFVPVSDLSDDYIKDWKPKFEPGQLVEGKIVRLDPATQEIWLSLKRSHIDADYQAPSTYADFQPGQIARGKIRKVEIFGVFVVLANSSNVSGLCHRSEMSEESVDDARTIFNEGESVTVKVLSVDSVNRRMTLGMKAAYFENEKSDSVVAQVSNEKTGQLEKPSRKKDPEARIRNRQQIEPAKTDTVERPVGISNGIERNSEPSGSAEILEPRPRVPVSEDEVLQVGAFDWNPQSAAHGEPQLPYVTDADATESRKSSRKRAVQIDETANLDASGPRSAADYERLLLSQPNSSFLWLGYMALYLEIEDVGKARQIAERAVRTINHQDLSFKQEVLDIWVAFLNLENTYGEESSLKHVFEHACEHNDAQEVHEHFASILIRSGKKSVSSNTNVPYNPL